MRILVTNDDGINAPGLWALVRELQDTFKVTVVAPDREQSGVSTSVTLHQPVRAQEISSPIPGIKAYAVQGTPADSVILAVKYLTKDKIDAVISGINEGPNLGNDIYISGTVGAALQGFFYHLPAIAISITAFADFHFAAAAKIAKLLLNKIKDNTLPKKILLNVNLPNLPLPEIESLEVTRLGERIYSDIVEEGHDGKRGYYWIRRGKSQWDRNQGTDILAIEHNQISITPLFNNPSSSIYNQLTTLAPTLFQELNNLDKTS